MFNWDSNQKIILRQGDNSSNIDNVGRRVNEKGYLIDSDGNIIDREGKRLFVKEHLKNGEFPKFFLFTKFNIANISGDYEKSPLSEPILSKDINGNLIDQQGRRVNSRGYLIDDFGNVIDKNGNRMFDKEVLNPDGDIPKLFRMQILQTDSGSSLSRLMEEIEKNQPSEYNANEEEEKERADQMASLEEEEDDGETSLDSAMEDTPANYNIPNQRFDEDYEAIPEEPDYRPSQSM